MSVIQHISHSTAESFASCGWRVYLQKVRRVPEQPSWALIGGSAVHRATENLDLADFGIETGGPKTFAEAFEECLAESMERHSVTESEIRATGKASKEFPDKRNKDYWLQVGQGHVNRWRNFLQSGYDVAIIDGQPAVELEFTVYIDGRVPFRGSIDRIIENSTYGAGIVDLKGLALDTKLPTPSGWTTMGDVRVGDQLFDASGLPCTVTAKSERKRIGTRVVKFDDGSEVVCDTEHIWWASYGRASRRGDPRPYSVLEIADRLGTERGKHFSVPVAGHLVQPELPLPIEPYLLGAWLGDGHSRDGIITKEDALFEILVADGHDLGVRQRQAPGKEHIATRSVVGLATALRVNGLKNNKHIPPKYLRASAEQRLALLQGLMDTDGTWNRARDRCKFCSCNRGLAESVVELLRSLGQRPHLAEVQRTGFGKTVTSFDIEFRPVGINPFRLPRKADQVAASTASGARSAQRLIVSVEPGPDVETQCIAVDSPNRTYLCGEAMIPTHNSGDTTPASPNQLLEYHLALSEVLESENPILWASYYLTKDKGGLTPPVEVGRYSADRIKFPLVTAYDGILAGRFMPRVSRDCGFCFVRDYCTFYGGHESNGYGVEDL